MGLAAPSPEPPLSHPTLGASQQQQGKDPSVLVSRLGWEGSEGKRKRGSSDFLLGFFFSFLFLKRVQLLRQKVSGGNETGANNVSLVKQVLKGPGGLV